MANLSNINNKLVLTTDGAALINQGSVDYGTAKLQVSGSGSTGTITWRNDGGRKTGYLYSDSAGVAIYSTALANAGIYLADNLQIDFRVNGSQRMIILESGNVGIAATPGTYLSSIRALRIGQGASFSAFTNSLNTYVSSNVRVDATGTNKAIVTGESAQYRQSDGLHIWYNAASVSAGATSTLTERMRIDSSGIVNIGTATGTQPSYFNSYLNVQNNASTSNHASITITSGSSGYAGLHFGDSDNGRIGQVAYNNSNNSLLFTANNSTRMTIDSSGNVGVGVTPFAHTLSTSASLDLKGNGGIWGYAGATYVNSNAYYNLGWKYKTTAPAAVLQVGGSSQELTFRQAVSGTAGNAITYTQPFTINTSGNVGIGGGAIEGKLSIDYTAAELPTSGTTSNSAIQVTSSLGNQLNLGLNTVSGDYGAYIQASDNNLAVPYPLNLQPNGGNVGIGTTSPEFKLDVKSNSDTAPSAYLRGGKSSQGEIQNTGLIVGTQTDMAAGDYQGISFTGYTSVSAIRRGRAAIGVEAVNGPGKMDLVFMAKHQDDGSQLSADDTKMIIKGSLTTSKQSRVGIGYDFVASKIHEPEGTNSLDVYGTGFFGYQDFRDHDTYPPQKVLVLRGAPASGAYAQSRFNWYTKSGTTSNGIAEIQIKTQYGTDAESGIKFSFGSGGEFYASEGILLGGTGSSNKLDFYQSGSWVPSVTSSGGAGFPAYSSIGYFQRVGKVVTVSFEFTISNLGTASGTVIINNLPVAIASGNGVKTVVGYGNIPTIGQSLSIYHYTAQNQIGMNKYDGSFAGTTYTTRGTVTYWAEL